MQKDFGTVRSCESRCSYGRSRTLPGDSARSPINGNYARRRYTGKRWHGLLRLPEEASSSRFFVVPTRCPEKICHILKSRLQGLGPMSGGPVSERATHSGDDRWLTKKLTEPHRFVTLMLECVLVVAVIALVWFLSFSQHTVTSSTASAAPPEPEYRPRQPLDTNGFVSLVKRLPRWTPDASLEDIGNIWRGAGHREIKKIDDHLSDPKPWLIFRGGNQPHGKGHRVPQLRRRPEARVRRPRPDARLKAAKNDGGLPGKRFYTIIYFQGVTALRLGETDNCVMCRERAPASCRSSPLRFTSIPPARAWRSVTSRNISSSFPTTSRFAGCSAWPA